MTTTLITGANKGLGFETARQLVAAGHTVYLSARNPEGGGTPPLGSEPVTCSLT